MDISINQIINLLAIELLEQLGNHAPKDDEIEHMESALQQIMADHSSFVEYELTQDEIVCFLLAAAQVSTSQSAAILQVSEQGLTNIQQSICHKLNTDTLAEAISEMAHKTKKN